MLVHIRLRGNSNDHIFLFLWHARQVNAHHISIIGTLRFVLVVLIYGQLFYIRNMVFV
jgi:hypothetical protein